MFTAPLCAIVSLYIYVYTSQTVSFNQRFFIQYAAATLCRSHVSLPKPTANSPHNSLTRIRVIQVHCIFHNITHFRLLDILTLKGVHVVVITTVLFQTFLGQSDSNALHECTITQSISVVEIL